MKIDDLDAAALRKITDHAAAEKVAGPMEKEVGDALHAVLTGCAQNAQNGGRSFGLSAHDQRQLGPEVIQRLNILMAARGFECKQGRAPFTNTVAFWWEW